MRVYVTVGWIHHTPLDFNSDANFKNNNNLTRGYNSMTRIVGYTLLL